LDVCVHLSIKIEQLDPSADVELTLSVTLLVGLEIHQLLEINSQTILKKCLLHLLAEQKIVVSTKEFRH